jgi:hypothetical protein
MAYIPFAYAHNNKGPHEYPVWQDKFLAPDIPASFIDTAGGQRFVPRNLPAGKSYVGDPPMQAAPPNYQGLWGVTPSFGGEQNTYFSNRLRWKMRPITGADIVPWRHQ